MDAESDRARAREELEASDLRFTIGFEHSPIGIALASSAGRYLKVNPALCRMLGRDEATLLAMTFQDVTHPDDLEDEMTQLRAMTSGASGSWEAEKRYLLPDGSVVWAQINSAVVAGEAGASDYVFSQIQDITEK
ncbi:MAG TPA: PAS domain S-box protein, partial [Acidimicrobiales bacterium]|nr:PAS domain S-box protein [Acidimicrobiales bacterium]